MFGTLQIALAKLLVVKVAADFQKKLPSIHLDEREAALAAHKARIKKLDSIIAGAKLI